MLRNEIKRAVTSRGMIVALLIGAFCIFYKHIQAFDDFIYINEYRHPVVNLDAIYFETFNTENFYSCWLPGSINPYNTYIYYFLGIIVALPFGVSYILDKKTGYIKNVCTRITRKRYFFNKFTATFISGGIAGVFPILLDLLLAKLRVPVDNWDTCNLYIWINMDWKAHIIDHPYLMAAFICILWFVFSGALACICLVAAGVISNIFTVQLMPFLCIVATLECERYIPVRYRDKWLPAQFLSTIQGYPAYGFVVSGIILAVAFCVFVLMQSRRDIL